MIKLIIFAIIILVVITSFSINLDFFVNGFNYITNFFNEIPQFLNYVKDTFNTFINAPVIQIITLTGIAFIVIQYGLSMLGDEKK